jgi:hypothetical protein
MNAIGRVSALSWLARLLLAALALIPGAVRGQAGYVHEITGNVRIQNGSGAAVAAKAGDTFVQGTTFETSANGRVVIKFEDGQLAALQPNTTVRINRYTYDPRNVRSSYSAVSLVKGASRLVTGVIGSTNREALHLAAGTFTIHVRGTDVTLLAGPTAETRTQTLAVNLGSVLLETGRGSVYVGTGQFVTMPTGEMPTPAGPVTIAPAAVQAAVNSLSATSLPINTPVVVASAARAAAADVQARVAIAAAEADPTNAQLRTAAQAAQSAAAAATRTATNQAAAAYKVAILAGYLPPTPPAFSSPTQQASAAALPEPTLPDLGCTGSPC